MKYKTIQSHNEYHVIWNATPQIHLLSRTLYKSQNQTVGDRAKIIISHGTQQHLFNILYDGIGYQIEFVSNRM